MPRIARNIGFDGRIFLEEMEWLTYCRRKPVRYIRKAKGSKCAACGLPDLPDNPLQNAHVIGFDIGVIDLGLTPDFLDSAANIVVAHRRTCNKGSELALPDSMIHLMTLGIRELPMFLPASIRNAWSATDMRHAAQSIAPVGGLDTGEQ